jgi:hypothetical protein
MNFLFIFELYKQSKLIFDTLLDSCKDGLSTTYITDRRIKVDFLMMNDVEERCPPNIYLEGFREATLKCVQDS